MSENNQNHTLDFEKAPAYSVLFHLGKKSMRPGGLQLTKRMLSELKIDSNDEVVEFAPGRGLTTKMVLELNPKSYTAVERDPISQQKVQDILGRGRQGQCVVGTAQATGLPNECATVVFGEAMLTLQTKEKKLQIAQEAFRLLKPGGRYGIHETCLLDNTAAKEKKNEIEKALLEALRVGARPLLLSEWKELLGEAGFSVQQFIEAPMNLLTPKRLIQDEGVLGTLSFLLRVKRSPGAHQRLHKIRGAFEKYGSYINSAVLIAEKPK
jgi:SAM-dependent methyltransferase